MKHLEDIDKKDSGMMMDVLDEVLYETITSFAKVSLGIGISKHALNRLRAKYPHFDWILCMMLDRNVGFKKTGV